MLCGQKSRPFGGGVYHRGMDILFTGFIALGALFTNVAALPPDMNVQVAQVAKVAAKTTPVPTPTAIETGDGTGATVANRNNNVDPLCKQWEESRKKTCITINNAIEVQKKSTRGGKNVALVLPKGCKADQDADGGYICEDKNEAATGKQDSYSYECNDKGLLNDKDRVSPYYYVEPKETKGDKKTQKANTNIQGKAYCVQDDRLSKLKDGCGLASGTGKASNKDTYGTARPTQGDKTKCSTGVVQFAGVPYSTNLKTKLEKELKCFNYQEKKFTGDSTNARMGGGVLSGYKESAYLNSNSVVTICRDDQETFQKLVKEEAEVLTGTNKKYLAAKAGGKFDDESVAKSGSFVPSVSSETPQKPGLPVQPLIPGQAKSEGGSGDTSTSRPVAAPGSPYCVENPEDQKCQVKLDLSRGADDVKVQREINNSRQDAYAKNRAELVEKRLKEDDEYRHYPSNRRQDIVDAVDSLRANEIILEDKKRQYFVKETLTKNEEAQLYDIAFEQELLKRRMEAITPTGYKTNPERLRELIQDPNSLGVSRIIFRGRMCAQAPSVENCRR
jgi:hypothetical protein